MMLPPVTAARPCSARALTDRGRRSCQRAHDESTDSRPRRIESRQRAVFPSGVIGARGPATTRGNARPRRSLWVAVVLLGTVCVPRRNAQRRLCVTRASTAQAPATTTRIFDVELHAPRGHRSEALPVRVRRAGRSHSSSGPVSDTVQPPPVEGIRGGSARLPVDIALNRRESALCPGPRREHEAPEFSN